MHPAFAAVPSRYPLAFDEKSDPFSVSLRLPSCCQNRRDNLRNRAARVPRGRPNATVKCGAPNRPPLPTNASSNAKTRNTSDAWHSQPAPTAPSASTEQPATEGAGFDVVATRTLSGTEVFLSVRPACFQAEGKSKGFRVGRKDLGESLHNGELLPTQHRGWPRLYIPTDQGRQQLAC